MSRDAILVAVTLGILALGMLYAVLGSRMSGQWSEWTGKAAMAAGATFGVGVLLLGLPGAFFLEAVTGPGVNLPPDSAWPLSLLLTFVCAVLVVPASLLTRLLSPATVGWAHAGATAVVAIFATFFAARRRGWAQSRSIRRV